MKEYNDLIPLVLEIAKKSGAIIDPFTMIGIRNQDEPQLDEFNDYIGFLYKGSLWLMKGTTDPGVYWTMNPITAAGATGAAHLCYGFHSRIWMLGVHMPGTGFAHSAFLQIGNSVRIWRDLNKDFNQDDNDIVQVGYFGINCHRAAKGTVVEKISNYSAGCQVVQNSDEFEFMYAKAQESEQKAFSYLMLDKSQIQVG